MTHPHRPSGAWLALGLGFSLLLGCNSVQGGETRVVLDADGWDGLPGSGYAINEGSGSASLEWDNGRAPDDGAGTTLNFQGGNSGRYRYASSYGNAETDLEGGALVVELTDYSGAGTYDGAAIERLSFTWRGEEDFDTGDQSSFTISEPADGDCVVTLESPVYGGSVTCSGVAPQIDGAEWAGAPFSFEAEWLSDRTPFR